MDRRRIISPDDSHAIRQQRALAAQQNMTPADIGKLMRKAAHDALDKNGVVTEADFIRANVPPSAISTRARAIIMEVVDERAHGGINA